MFRRTFARLLAASSAVAALGLPLLAQADEAPDAMIRRLSSETLEVIKSDPALRGGDLTRVMALVDSKVMPNVNFQRMTAAAVGPQWRQATPAQRARLQEEFKTLLVRTYSGALSQVNDQSITVRPMRAAPTDNEVVVRTEITGRGDPIQLDYRMERTPGQGTGWKIYNLNVLGVWLVETYRSQFAQQLNAGGIDGLIQTLAARNKSNERRG